MIIRQKQILKRGVISIIFIFFFSSCRNTTETNLSSNATFTETPSQMMSSLEVGKPPVVETETSSPLNADDVEPSLTGIAIPSISQPELSDGSCQSIKVISVEEFQWPEAILVSVVQQGDKILFSHTNSYQLPEAFGFMAVSPDHSKIAYSKSSLLQIFGKEGGLQEKFHAPTEDLVTIGWIDSHRILFFANLIDPNFALTFDLIAQNFSSIPIDFPEISKGDRQPGSNWNSTSLGMDRNRLVIAPSTKNLLYPTAYGDFDSFGDVVIWDTEKAADVARVSGIDSDSSAPVFSPDGRNFVVELLKKQAKTNPTVADYDNSNGNIFLVDLEGNIEQLTNFEKGIRTGNYSWSPDGTKIAFWVDNLFKAGGEKYLGVLDVTDKILITYCVWGFGEIFWSQDGGHLLISMDDNSSYPFPVSVVNIDEEWISLIIDDAEPFGWVLLGED